MSYTGMRLAPLFDGRLIAPTCREMAEHGGERMTTLVRQNTPIGHQPFSENYIPGALRASIEQKILVVYPSPRGLVYESGSETSLYYAVYVEDGTGIYHTPDPHTPWEVTPKRPGGWLRWIDQKTGKVIFARKVIVPGAPGSHMFAIGVALTEHEFNIFGQRMVQTWARRQERLGLEQVPVKIGRVA